MDKNDAKKYIKEYFLDSERMIVTQRNMKNFEVTLEKYRLLSIEYKDTHSEMFNQIEKRMALVEDEVLKSFIELASIQLRMKTVESILNYLSQDEIELLRQKIYEGKLETQIEISGVVLPRSTIFRKMDKIYKLFENLNEHKTLDISQNCSEDNEQKF